MSFVEIPASGLHTESGDFGATVLVFDAGVLGISRGRRGILVMSGLTGGESNGGVPRGRRWSCG